MFGLPAGTVLAIVVLIVGIILALVVPPALAEAERAKVRRENTYRSRERDIPERDGRAERKLRNRILLWTTAISAALILIASFTYVPARTVAVPVTLGKAGASFGSGPTMVSPFTRVEKFDASVQTLELSGDGTDKDGPEVPVRLGNQTQATVDVTRLAWNLNADGDISRLYNRYRSFNKVEPNLIKGQVISAVQQVMSSFDPLAGLGESGPNADKPKTIAQLQTEVQQKMEESITALVGANAVTVEVPQLYVRYDGTTQAKLNDYAKALAETRIAVQSKATATAVREANEELAKNAKTSENPSVAYQNCLQLLRDLAARGQLKDLPINALQCTIPGSQSGTSSLIVPAR